MTDKIHVIYGGARPLYEVIESEDEVSVTIRYAGDHKERIRLHRSGVAALVNALKDIKPAAQQLRTQAPPEHASAVTASASR